MITDFIKSANTPKEQAHRLLLQSLPSFLGSDFMSMLHRGKRLRAVRRRHYEETLYITKSPGQDDIVNKKITLSIIHLLFGDLKAA